MTQLQSLQAHIATIRNEGRILEDLTNKYPALAAMFKNSDDQMSFLLSQPPMTFMVCFFPNFSPIILWY